MRSTAKLNWGRYALVLVSAMVVIAAGAVLLRRAAVPPDLEVTSMQASSDPVPLPAEPAYPLQVSANGRYLVDQDNQPVFWSGDTAWSLIVEGTTAQIDAYFASRKQRGFNVVLVNLIDTKFGSNAPSNIYGAAPFTGEPFVTPNEAYFAHADYVVAEAARNGIAILLDALYLGWSCNDEGWCADAQAASLNDMQAWGQYVGARYEPYDNIVWVVGGDMDSTTYGMSEKVTAFVDGLRQADSRHLITVHNDRGQMAVTPWPGANWVTVNNIYEPFSGLLAQARAAYEYSPTMPYFLVEGFYENDEHNLSQQQLRAQSYWSVLSGGFGYLFGNCPVWGLGSYATVSVYCPGEDSDWLSDLDQPGAINTQYVQNLFAPRAWHTLVPDWDHEIITSGYGSWPNANYVAAARTADGKLVIAYLPTVRSVTVNLAQLSAPATARWYDPSNGAYITILGSPFNNSGSRVFRPGGPNSSGAGDWVLVLEVGAEPTSWHFLPSVTRASPGADTLSRPNWTDRPRWR
jgi:hypothetical protein